MSNNIETEIDHNLVEWEFSNHYNGTGLLQSARVGQHLIQITSTGNGLSYQICERSGRVLHRGGWFQRGMPGCSLDNVQWNAIHDYNNGVGL